MSTKFPQPTRHAQPKTRLYWQLWRLALQNRGIAVTLPGRGESLSYANRSAPLTLLSVIATLAFVPYPQTDTSAR